MFPNLDPIPLPAPVWLFKLLHILTLSLHFVAVELLLGSLLIATLLNLLGSRNRGSETSSLRLNASASLAKRLPMIMTYVINLGVPPLLFAQVLYGRALYTSSVLIGAFWISVIFLLMACYWLIYRFSAGTEKGQSVWWIGALAWLLAGSIAKILNSNMTLMIQPDLWTQMYVNSAAGVNLPPHDIVRWLRWGFMLIGGLVFGGLWMIWLAGRKNIDTAVRSYLAKVGGTVAMVAVAWQGFLVFQLLNVLPADLLTPLADNIFYKAAGFTWIGAASLILLLAAVAGFAKPTSAGIGWIGALLALLAAIGFTGFRDGIRDLTLLKHGFDVWQQAVLINWSVLISFLVLFVAGLVAIGWLISVMARAKPVSEKVV